MVIWYTAMTSVGWWKNLSFKVSLKAVLLHNGNKQPSIPLAHAGHMKEIYANIQGLLNKICYEDHQWNIYADLKVVAMLTRLQGHTKIFCFLCEWDRRARDRHYHVKQWLLWAETILDQKNVTQWALVNKIKIYLSPLHIKLGVNKISLRVMNKEGRGCDYLRQKVPCISEAKTQEGIFISPQVQQLFQELNFTNKLYAAKRRTWDRIWKCMQQLFGNKNSETYAKIME